MDKLDQNTEQTEAKREEPKEQEITPFGLPNLATDEEISRKIVEEAKDFYESHKSDREQFDDIAVVADYMYKAAQNRTVNAAERTKGANLDTDDSKANVGSTIFHRIVNQGAAQGVAVQMSKPVPFKYEPIVNEMVDYSYERANEMANQLNLLASWTMKKDRFTNKSIEFWHQIRKYSNVPVMVQQKVIRGVRTIRVPEYEEVMGQDGVPYLQEAGYKLEQKEYIIDNYPSIDIMPFSSLYIDPYVGNIQAQNCVVAEKLVNRGDIYEDVVTGLFSKEQYDKLSEQYEWDGTAGSEVKQEIAENTNKLYDAKGNKRFLRRDIFIRVPIEDGKWNEEAVPALFWVVVIGNTIDDGVVMLVQRNHDPDDEIPIEMIHEKPDDPDLAYHVASAEIIRSNYSVECTLKGMAVDNIGLVNNPPLCVLEGMHHIKDFRYKKGAIFPVESQEAVKELIVQDRSQATTNLLEYIKQDSMTALNTDKSMVGEEFGGRTSATEASAINRNSLQPNLVGVRYILDQWLYWYAKKIQSYWKKFATPEQVIRITSEGLYEEIKPRLIFGDYDVEINIVDEFEADIVRETKIYQALNMIGGNPAFQQSNTHTLDIGELLKEWLSKAKFNVQKIVRPPIGVDSKRVARLENNHMLNTGQYDPPQQGEDHNSHLLEHKGFRIRYNGLEEQYPNIELIDQHIAETEQLSVGTQGGAGMEMTGNQSEGEAVGNEMAGAMGEMMGGQQ